MDRIVGIISLVSVDKVVGVVFLVFLSLMAILLLKAGFNRCRQYENGDNELAFVAPMVGAGLFGGFAVVLANSLFGLKLLIFF